MSDSDDTNVLLLIPPNYFLAESSSAEGSCSDLARFTSVTDLRGIAPLCMSMTDERHCNNVELDTINWKLSSFERKLKEERNIASNSNSPTQSCALHNPMNYPIKLPSQLPTDTMNYNVIGEFCHSTPKVNSTATGPLRDDNFIREIDHLLDERKPLTPIRQYNDFKMTKSDYKTLATQAIQKHNHLASSHKEESGKLEYRSYGNETQFNDVVGATGDQSAKTISPERLISLSNIWGAEGHTESTTHQEERMRRQHCEKTIQMLQSRLLECQQKISVAMKVDHKKDDALAKLHETNSSLIARIHHLEAMLSEVKLRIDDAKHCADAENAELKQKNSRLEAELSQTIDMARKLQERNELLENKSESLTKTSNEIRDIHRRQLEDLEIRVSNGRQTEKLLCTEIDKLKNYNATLQSNCDEISKELEPLKKQNQAMQEEVVSLKQQKVKAEEKVIDERARADHLDKQKQTLSSNNEALLNNEKTLRKELDNQRISLKAYYQDQLEQVVAMKLNEFQKQLDTVEETLKIESKQRERLIAERAMKQMELINQKNDQEFGLLTEKHSEEIELYRIQLSNASRTVHQLEQKLSAYQSRRSDIAERLHNVMETQWKRTLEIITSPASAEAVPGRTTVTSAIDASRLDRDRADGVAGLYQNRPENETFETPVRHRERLNEAATTGGCNDKLQQYIELLLKKSPRDLEQLNTILNMPTKADASTASGINRKEATKKPWK